MKGITIQELYDLRETIAAELFEGKIFPWEVLPEIGAFLVKLGNTLPEEEYEKKGENIWIARDAKVAPTASITVSLYHRERCGSETLCVYPRQCPGGRGGSGWKFYRAEKCDPV